MKRKFSSSFFHGKNYEKTGWAKPWAIFSQTRLATLLICNEVTYMSVLAELLKIKNPFMIYFFEKLTYVCYWR
jgi:hypothetical protein